MHSLRVIALFFFSSGFNPCFILHLQASVVLFGLQINFSQKGFWKQGRLASLIYPSVGELHLGGVFQQAISENVL
jgi:hypothetical protein